MGPFNSFILLFFLPPVKVSISTSGTHWNLLRGFMCAKSFVCRLLCLHARAVWGVHFSPVPFHYLSGKSHRQHQPPLQWWGERHSWKRWHLMTAAKPSLLVCRQVHQIKCRTFLCLVRTKSTLKLKWRFLELIWWGREHYIVFILSCEGFGYSWF